MQWLFNNAQMSGGKKQGDRARGCDVNTTDKSSVQWQA
jgi:hypothetical protein